MKLSKIALYSVFVIAFSACKKDKTIIGSGVVAPPPVVVVPPIQVGKIIPNTSPLVAGNYKGTMLAGQTYTITGDVTVSTGDTLLIQSGVHINMVNSPNFIVKGTLLSLGTKAAPITITDPRRTMTTGSSTVKTDSAYSGGWGGIYCSTSCPLLVIKWTHLNFGGAALKSSPFTGPSKGNQYIIYFGNPAGNLVLEDSWVYGTPDDIARVYGGHINIMRNTLEKCGSTGGDGFNIKGGTQGNFAYNLIIGAATNGIKISNTSPVSGIPAEIEIYNNSFLNCGYRNPGTYGERGGSIEMENGAVGLAYNNIIADCNFGMRVAGGTDTTANIFMADTSTTTSGPIAKLAYGYNFYYADVVTQADQFVPTNVDVPVITHPQATGIPNMAAFLGSTYTFGFKYDGTSLVGKNNPSFSNYPLPNTGYLTQASVDGFSFNLATGSPAIGIGYQGFTQIKNVPVDPNFGSSSITGPGKDIGCYQQDGSGNQH